MRALTGLLAASAVLAAGAAGAATVDVVEFPTGFFAPDEAATFDSPYYRGAGEDWGWAHDAITEAFTTVSLLISAFDVDFASGEVDTIYAYDDGVLVELGQLTGSDSAYAFTEFVLPATLYDDVAEGLELFMDIDVAQAGWFVTLGKSVLTTDGAAPPPPDPGTVPLPAAGVLLLGGLGGLAALRRRRAG